MAEDPDEDGSWSASSLGCGVFLVALTALVWGVGLDNSSRFDPVERCVERQSGDCLAVESGFVTSSGGFLDRVAVVYDDGRRRETVIIASRDVPPEGSRVRVERWDDAIVALVDMRNERRYKTVAWPEKWKNPGGIMLLALGIVALAGGVPYVVSRRRQAASTS